MLVVGHVRTPCGRVVQRQYRSITRREYYRLARAERDTGGPSVVPDGRGRTVYGGGGIYPDVPLEGRRAGRRAGRAGSTSSSCSMMWSGGYVDAHAATLGDPDTFATHELPAEALADFRAFAAKQGVAVLPEGDDLLRELLVESIAYARWGRGASTR